MDEETKVCKCCGATKPITSFDKCNTGKRISLCRECRRAQQTINNFKRRNDLNDVQAQRLLNAIDYMQRCKEITGFETGHYSSKVGSTVQSPTMAAGTTNTTSLENLAHKAAIHRAKLKSLGVDLQPPTLEVIVHSNVQFLVESGYTRDECFAVIDAEVNHDSDDYFDLSDKLYHMPL
jgi:hypothetical protein